MKKLILLILVFSIFTVQAQDIFFKTGLNSSVFDFKDKYGVKLNTLLPEIGNSFQLGAGFPLFDKLIRYELGLTLDEYNSTNEDSFNNYRWNTTYGGIKNSIGVYPYVNEFTIGVVAQLGLAKILTGTQHINNSTYSLITNPEFSGLMVQPGLGLAVSYNLLNHTLLNFQYDYSKSFRVRNPQEERVSFTTNRILVGVHLYID